MALKSKRQGARVVRRLAVVWVGVGGLSGGDPARLVDMTPYRRPAAPCWRARLAPVGVGTPYHTCSQRVLHSLTPGRRAGRDVGLVGHVPAVTSSPQAGPARRAETKGVRTDDRTGPYRPYARERKEKRTAGGQQREGHERERG